MSATRPARLSDRRRAWRRSASNGLESFALGYVGLSIFSALIVLDDIFLLGRPQPMAVMDGFADRLRDWHVRLDDPDARRFRPACRRDRPTACRTARPTDDCPFRRRSAAH